MENPTLQKIADLKNSEFRSTSVTGKINDEQFKLVLVTRDCEYIPEVIELLGRWRKENEFWFQAIFPVSYEGTKTWLIKNLTDVPDRLLFLIEADNRFIGHVGLWRFDFGGSACEIDNAVRGEKAIPGIMYKSFERLQQWAREQLMIKTFYLQTFLENEKAVKLYKRLGYEIIKIEPLTKIIGDNRIEWVQTTETTGIERHNIHMKLNPDVL